MKRRAAVEPVIGHTKAEHRMGRNYLKGRDGDRINAVLAAAGYNFALLLRWLARLLRALFQALATTSPEVRLAKTGAQPFFTGDYLPTFPEHGVRALRLMQEFVLGQKWIMADPTFGTFVGEVVEVSEDGMSGTVIIRDDQENEVDVFT